MARIRVSVSLLGDGHALVKLSSRIALITKTLKRAGKGGRMAKVVSAYLGFDSYGQAQAAASDLRRRFPKARLQVRKAERLATAFEVKFTHEVAEAICWEMLKQIETTGRRVSRHLQAVASMPSVAADVPSIRLHNRGAGRQTVTVGGRALSIN